MKKRQLGAALGAPRVRDANPGCRMGDSAARMRRACIAVKRQLHRTTHGARHSPKGGFGERLRLTGLPGAWRSIPRQS